MSFYPSIHDCLHIQQLEDCHPLLSDKVIQCHHCKQRKAQPGVHSHIREPLAKPKAVKKCFFTTYKFTALRNVYFCSTHCKQEFLSAKLCVRCRRVDLPLDTEGRLQVCAVPPRPGAPSCKLMSDYFF